MNKKITSIAGALATATVLLPGIANASFLLDTGIPGGTSAPLTLSSTSWVAAEFAATGAETITSISAYLTPALSTTAVNDTFTFNIYSDTGFIGGRSPAPLQSFTGTYTAAGWTTTSVDWTLPASGNYWLALQVGGTTQPTKGLDLPIEASTQTGTEPAEAFAVLNSNTSKRFTTTGALPFGVEVSVSPVPLPAGIWLLGSGLMGLGAMMKRRGRA